MHKFIFTLSGIALLGASAQSAAFTFELGEVSGAFDSVISAGAGMRTDTPSCGLVTQGAHGHSVPDACLSPVAGIGDQGNLNYAKGDLYTGYLKGVHELLLRLPDDYTVMVRGSWKRDFAATRTSGTLGWDRPPGVDSDGLSDAARDELEFKARLLDLWVSKSFYVGGRPLRARLGNQAINWGESLFASGGINETNGYDVMALSTPGTQLKEALLPAPIFSLAGGLGAGVTFEAYYQFGWEKTEMPPVGSYWSTTNALGEGMQAYGYRERDARDSGQWGLSLNWQPANTDLNLGFYVLRYHDKLPSLFIDQTTFAPTWVYPEDRMLYGVSANFPVGDWAVGTELSYRPEDAVALNPTFGCTGKQGECWQDEKKFQWHLTGMYSMVPSNSGWLLDLTGASTGSVLTELVVVEYPDLEDEYNGELVSAGVNTWMLDPAVLPTAQGNGTTSGISADLSLTYDGTLIPGWQVTPGVFYSRSLKGRTPTLAAPYMDGASSMNLYLNFVRNPGTWQVTLNYATFSGGDSPYDQLLEDRDYVGLVLSRSL
ncbi:DUF1302 domain-containing protein [Halopseudomonas oceani]|uniref:DUF1302 domain-containing protein n=1 Tax=Halopseudomonas oceani TaxID=1708783 RepID=UPI002AA77C24|nr:DUF1302 domain-containing protein [Halopseudomonas oceani]